MFGVGFVYVDVFGFGNVGIKVDGVVGGVDVG